MKKTPYLFLLVAPLLAMILVGIQVYYTAYVWKYQGADVVFEIKPAESFSSINSRLDKEKLIASARFFHRYSQFKGTMNKFKSGKFLIRQNSNLFDVYNTLLQGKSIANLVTVPEGRNMYEIAAMLESRKITNAEDFLTLAKDPEFLQKMGINAPTAEGYLYPDTYDFSENLTAEVVMSAMIRLFNKKTEGLDYSKSKLSKEQIITLASMVEKETGVPSERATIAGVFFNRLKKKMRLQSDPTTIYGMWEKYDGNIKKKDLLTHSEYNTYTIPALPIGPISNPGLNAIKAVLNPEKNNFIFFVSQNDGTHVFTETYNEHKEAVNKWQRNSKNREGKSWRDLNKKEATPAVNLEN